MATDLSNSLPILLLFRAFPGPDLEVKLPYLSKTSKIIDIAVVLASHTIGVCHLRSVLERQPGIVEYQLPNPFMSDDKQSQS